MKARGMIFNSEMVRAILDGRKTQTRRIMKIQPEHSGLGLRRVIASGCARHGRSWVTKTVAVWTGMTICVRATKRLLRAFTVLVVNSAPEIMGCGLYPTMPTGSRALKMKNLKARGDHPSKCRDGPAADVRVERLNDISQEDAQAEGMALTGWRPTYSDPDSGGEVWTPYDNFARLWESIYGEGSWKANPWVWVIEFKRVEGGAA